jgi:hypothetical protein
MRRLLRATSVVLLLGTLFLYSLLAPTPHRIDEAHFQLITEGMTEAEVEAIFGVPAGLRLGKAHLRRTGTDISHGRGMTAEAIEIDDSGATRSEAWYDGRSERVKGC